MNDSNYQGLILNEIGLATIWGYDHGIIEESVVNMDHFGNAIRKYVQKRLPDALYQLAGASLTPETMPARKITLEHDGNKELLNPGILDRDASFTTVSIGTINAPLGKYEAKIMLAKESEEHCTTVCANSGVFLNPTLNASDAVKSLYELCNLQDKICLAIGDLMPVPGLGRLKYYFHAPVVATPDFEFMSILPGISEHKNRYYLDSSEITDKELIMKLNEFYSIANDPILNLQHLSPKAKARISKLEML